MRQTPFSIGMRRLIKKLLAYQQTKLVQRVKSTFGPK